MELGPEANFVGLFLKMPPIFGDALGIHNLLR